MTDREVRYNNITLVLRAWKKNDGNLTHYTTATVQTSRRDIILSIV